MSDLEKATNRNISLPEKAWQEIDELADRWDVKRSVAFRLIFNEWKQLRANSQLGKQAPITIETDQPQALAA